MKGKIGKSAINITGFDNTIKATNKLRERSKSIPEEFDLGIGIPTLTKEDFMKQYKKKDNYTIVITVTSSERIPKSFNHALLSIGIKYYNKTIDKEVERSISNCTGTSKKWIGHIVSSIAKQPHGIAWTRYPATGIEHYFYEFLVEKEDIILIKDLFIKALNKKGVWSEEFNSAIKNIKPEDLNRKVIEGIVAFI